MRIIIAGGSGFIGQALAPHLVNAGHQVIVLSRNPQQTRSQFKNEIKCLRWKDFDPSAWYSELESTDIIINLIGENISQWPWTNKLKKQILNSRLKAGQTITQAIKKARNKPRILIQSSATGFYGSNNYDRLTEDAPAGIGFLADVCQKWEKSSAGIEAQGVKHIIIRTGLVLGNNGGLLKKMIIPFRLFIGGPIGSGKQILPWIHIKDVVDAIRFIIEKNIDMIVYNLCAPNPVNMNTFARTLAKTINRPVLFKVPEFIVKIVFGEMGRETILAGQNAIPKALIDSGYNFKYPKIQNAISDLFKQY